MQQKEAVYFDCDARDVASVSFCVALRLFAWFPQILAKFSKQPAPRDRSNTIRVEHDLARLSRNCASA